MQNANRPRFTEQTDLQSLLARIHDQSCLFRVLRRDADSVLEPHALAAILDACDFQTAATLVAPLGAGGCLVGLVPVQDGCIDDFEAELARRCLEERGDLVDLSPAASNRSSERLTGLNEMLESLLGQKIGVQFQPILDLRESRVTAYEALARIPQSGRLKRSGEYFHAADQARVVAWLDLGFLRGAFTGAARAGLRRSLFVNVVAEGLSHLQESGHSVAAEAEAHGIPARSLVIELTERQAAPDFPALCSHLAELRQAGVRIAIDDAGEGYSSLGLLLKLQPDIVKVERAMIRGVDSDGPRRAVLGALVRCAAEVGADVVAEGIQTFDELRVVWDLGIRFAQGYRIGRPADDFRGARRAVLEEVAQLKAMRARSQGSDGPRVRDAARQGEVVEAATPLADCVRRFRREPGLKSVAVVDQGRFVGFLRRESLDGAAALDASKGCAEDLALPADRMYDGGASLADAARAEARSSRRSGLPAVILEGDRYAGMIDACDLLEAMAGCMPGDQSREMPIAA